MAAGAVYFISPSHIGKILMVQMGEEWLSQIRLDPVIMMIHMMARVLSVLLFFGGLIDDYAAVRSPEIPVDDIS